MEIGSLKRDSAAVAAGKWVSDIPGFGDVRLRVRGFGSPVAMSYRQRKERAVARSERHRDGSLKPEAALAILKDLLAEVILLDWDGLTDDGKAVPYDPDLARQWLSDPDMEAFADGVAWAAQVVDRGYADEKEASEKN